MHELTMSGRVAGGAPQPRLEMRWLPVTDQHGAARMQAVWIDAAAASVSAHHAA